MVIRGEAQSTNALFELILRLRRPQEGRIGLDGVNARKLRVRDIRERIGWVDAQRNNVCATLLTSKVDQIERGLESIELIPTRRPSVKELESLRSLEQQGWVSGALGLRLGIACAMVHDPSVLLIDQPELGLTRKEINGFKEWVERESSKRLIVVASNRGWTRSIASKVISLRADSARKKHSQD
jgi:ABC-type multidrug transport system ATPase subunit